MNDYPIKLKDADSPSPPDPQQTGIELLALLRSLTDETQHLRALLTRWGDEPVSVMRRAQGRSIEIHEQTARALDAAETLMLSLRAARLFSASYSEDVGVHEHGR